MGKMIDIKAKVELNAIEAGLILDDALFAYERVCNRETKPDCARMRIAVREAFGKDKIYLH